eukprot:jgi/Mesvir1/4341/Mv06698-RA.2
MACTSAFLQVASSVSCPSHICGLHDSPVAGRREVSVPVASETGRRQQRLPVRPALDRPNYLSRGRSTRPSNGRSKFDVNVRAMASEDARPATTASQEVTERFWTWRGHKIRYQESGVREEPSQDTARPAIVLIHGFGSNSDHWRKNTPVLAQHAHVYALDLLGYGYSDKPSPRGRPLNSVYSMENWAALVEDFVREVVGRPVFTACNSVGSIVGLQAAAEAPDLFKGVVVLNASHRGLHESKVNPALKPFLGSFQWLLRETPAGAAFFGSLAKPATVKQVLEEAYGNKSAVTDELVDIILQPGLQPGATDVFLDFISYSTGPLMDTLLPRVTVPVAIGWGEKDPWEAVALAGPYAKFPCVEDEGPEEVNSFISSFVQRHWAKGAREPQAQDNQMSTTA